MAWMGGADNQRCVVYAEGIQCCVKRKRYNAFFAVSQVLHAVKFTGSG